MMIFFFQDEILSPAVAERLMWFFERWSKCYLMPDESPYYPESPLGFEYAEHGRGNEYAKILFQKILNNLAVWAPTEPSLAEQTCAFFQNLIGIKAVRSFLVDTDQFQDLLLADGTFNAFLTLSTHSRISFVRSICTTCSSAAEPKRSQNFEKYLAPIKV